MSIGVAGVAAVTGGSAGIGKAICEHLLAQGFEVVSLARRASESAHARMHSIEVDLTDRRAGVHIAAMEPGESRTVGNCRAGLSSAGCGV